MSDDNPQTAAEELPKSRHELLARIEGSRAALEELLGSLGEEQLGAPGGPDGWSVKDHIGHLTPWQRGIDALLQRRPRHEAMGLTREQYLEAGIERVNELLQQRCRAQSPGEVLADFRQSLADLLATLERLPEEELFKPYSYFQPEEPGEERSRPIIAWIAGNTYEHYDEHIGWIRQLVGARSEE